MSRYSRRPMRRPTEDAALNRVHKDKNAFLPSEERAYAQAARLRAYKQQLNKPSLHKSPPSQIVEDVDIARALLREGFAPKGATWRRGV